MKLFNSRKQGDLLTNLGKSGGGIGTWVGGGEVSLPDLAELGDDKVRNLVL